MGVKLTDRGGKVIDEAAFAAQQRVVFDPLHRFAATEAAGCGWSHVG